MSDEKKITLEELEDLLEEDAGGAGQSRLNFQTIFAALVLNWHWFLLSLIICICGALIYLRYTEPVYEVSARMLIKDQSNSNSASQMLASVEDLGFLSNSTGIDNEVEVLQSRILLRDVVKDLKLYTEYRREGRVKDAIIYAQQPINIDLDPEHLDSLDFNLLEGTQWLDMKVWREGKEYLLTGLVMGGSHEGKPFECRIKTLPATYKTELGTLTITENPGRRWEEGKAYYVTIRPPMQVATEYLSRLTIEPTSKSTSIAKLTLKDKNYRRGMDVLRQLCICYNRQANADKNEVAMRTEEFINDRMAKIDIELGGTEKEIQEFKQQNAVTSMADASQSVQMSNEFSARLSEANSKVEMLDYMREYVNDPQNKYQLIPSNVGVTDAASTSLINSYNQAVLDRNHLLKAASEEAPQVKSLVEEGNQKINEAREEAQKSLQDNPDMSQEDAQKAQADAQRKMASLNQSYQMQLQQKVSAALQDIAKEKKLDVVVDSEKEQPTALMGCVDVTDDVIAKLQ